MGNYLTSHTINETGLGADIQLLVSHYLPVGDV